MFLYNVVTLIDHNYKNNPTCTFQGGGSCFASFQIQQGFVLSLFVACSLIIGYCFRVCKV